MRKKRTSRTRLPKQQKCVTGTGKIASKYCKQILLTLQKTGHSRDECWSKKGRPGDKVKPPEHKKKRAKKVRATGKNSVIGNANPNPKAAVAEASQTR